MMNHPIRYMLTILLKGFVVCIILGLLAVILGDLALQGAEPRVRQSTVNRDKLVALLEYHILVSQRYQVNFPGDRYFKGREEYAQQLLALVDSIDADPHNPLRDERPAVPTVGELRVLPSP